MDRTLDVRRLLGPDRVELGLSSDESVEPGHERRDVRRPPPETHHRLLEGEDLAAESRERGRAHVSNVGADAGLELGRELTGGGLDPDDPQAGSDAGVRAVGGRREADRDATSQVDAAALGEGETHRDLIEGAGEPAAQQLEPVDAGPDGRLAEDDEDRLGHEEVHSSRRRHLRESPYLFEGWGDDAGPELGEDRDVRASLRAVEAAVGTVRSPRAHRGGHHRARAERSHQSQAEPGAPRPQFAPGPHEDRTHRDRHLWMWPKEVRCALLGHQTYGRRTPGTATTPTARGGTSVRKRDAGREGPVSVR